MNAVDVIALVFLVLGSGFFLAGTVGMLRFPDVHSRLHALTKADNLGLGFVVLGLAISSGVPFVILKLTLIWLLAIFASTTVSQLIAKAAFREVDPRKAADA